MEEIKDLINESGKEIVSNDSGVDYISAINEIKQNSVSREQYEKLVSENKQLLDTLINGGQIEALQVAPPNIDELRNELFGKEAVDKGMTNLEFVEKTLKLRDAIIESGGVDPFLPIGKGIDLTRDDYDAAELTAQVFKECVEVAQGDSDIFTNELMRRTVDNGTPTAKIKNPYRR